MTTPPSLRVLHVFATFDVGGPQRRTLELVRQWDARRRARGEAPVEHTVIANDGRCGAAELWPAGVALETVDAPRVGGLLARLRAMVKLLRARRPDLLLTSNWGAIEWVVAARLAGLRSVVHHEDGFNADEQERRLPRRTWFRRIALRWAGAVVVPSRVLVRIAREEWRVPPVRLHWLPNGVDTERFRPVGPEREDGGTFELVMVGGLRAVKNHALALRAFAAAAWPEGVHARLTLVGDGDERARLEALAAELGIGDRVAFAGSTDDTAPFYRTADAFVLSSDSEQMPIALLEAMASGLPAACTDVGDVGAILAEENEGFVVPARDIEGLAGAFVALASDEAERTRLGAANRRVVEARYEKNACWDAFLAVYDEVARWR